MRSISESAPNSSSHDPSGLPWVLRCTPLDSAEAHRRVPGSRDSPPSCANISIGNRMARTGILYLSIIGRYGLVRLASSILSNPLSTAGSPRGVGAPDHPLIVTRQCFLHTLCHENTYDFRGGKPSRGAGGFLKYSRCRLELVHLGS